MRALLGLKNIGPKTVGWLEAVGIRDKDDLIAAGAVEVYIRLKHTFPEHVSLVALWALQGAIMGLPFNEIPDDVKTDLLDELHNHPDFNVRT